MDKSNANGTLKCNQCGKIDHPNIEEKPHSHGIHVTAYCFHCNAYIKHLPQTNTLRMMPFGKYKDKAFSQIANIDPEYLEWLCDQPDMGERIRDAAEGALYINKEGS